MNNQIFVAMAAGTLILSILAIGCDREILDESMPNPPIDPKPSGR